MAIRDRALLLGLKLLPKNHLSRVAGRIAALELPPSLARAQVRAFARAFNVNFDEIRDPLESFPSVQSFFTRALREGARPIDPAPDAFVSPCDGAWGAAGTIERGTLLQVKGRPYRVADLLRDEEVARRFEGGTFATLYLSPRDYHRFHTPLAGRIARARYIAGALWPVNRAGVSHVDGLFSTNERVVALLDTEGGGQVAMIAVGATLVGKVHVTFDDTLTTNVPGASTSWHEYGAAAPTFEKGQEWGRFEFGSTIVLVATPGTATLDVPDIGTPVRLGARIGTFRA
jgi:phosphatidylserine decarboxylase